MTKRSAVVFGATGSIGAAICQQFLSAGYEVTAVSRTGLGPLFVTNRIVWDAESLENKQYFSDLTPFDAIVWAQGSNCSDDIFSFDRSVHEHMYASNVTYILSSLQVLLESNLVGEKARLCIISSIWQNIARQNKLSYCITKSALQGLVQSLSIDLGFKGYLVNAVLPGPLDTPMTRANLTEQQIEKLEGLIPLGALPSLTDVCNLVEFLCGEKNTGINGQFIAADKGFSYARIM